MKKYFYSDGNEKNGPFSINELKNENVMNDTLIWFEGLNDWTKAINLDEMKPILEINPPPIPTSFDKEPDLVISEEKPKEKQSSEKRSTESAHTKQDMFSRSFSFDGRIRRTEYGISVIIYLIGVFIYNMILESGEAPYIIFAAIPLLWFVWAQGAKRCHDLGQSGWYQIIPFYVLWMIFGSGKNGINRYGVNPKS